MSLLTEEQIMTLAYYIWETDHDDSKTLEEIISEWNEVQTGIQVNVNWDLAPKEATSADVKIQWRGVENAWTFEAVFANIPRPKAPHPHADIIAKYAEVAARRCDPWVEFEWFDRINDTWAICRFPIAFAEERSYRHIGDKSDPMTARKGDDKPWNLNRDD